MKDKDKIILQAVDALKRSPFGATAVKLELEGRLNRSNRSDRRYCYNCDGGRWVDCAACGSLGEFEFDPELHTEDDRDCGCGQETCPQYNAVECSGCGGEGRVICEAEGCSDGTVPVNNADNRNWSDVIVCQDFILEYLSQFGLAKRIRSDADRELAARRTCRYGNWTPKGALRFCHFYADPSVDSECTMTLMLTNKQDILLLPKLVEAFNALGEAIGNGVSIDNAGMHFSIISHPNGTYDEEASQSSVQQTCFTNFKRSMSLLMPALYFLGASNERTRSLHFREPRVDDYEKYSAVYWVGNALEFRVFDPCYDNPEQVLDDFVVIKNCMRYWNERYVNPQLDKITTQISFGVDGNDRVDRFYGSVKHIELLNTGLKRLKPTYCTIKELKKQRGFTLTKSRFASQERKVRKQAEIEYREYADRFEWRLRQVYYSRFGELMGQRANETSKGELLEPKRKQLESEIAAEARLMVKNEKRNKKTLEQYIEEQVEKLNRRNLGDYTLSA